MTGADGEKRGSDHYEARGGSAGTVRGVGGVVTWHADRPPPPGPPLPSTVAQVNTACWVGVIF